MREYSKVVMYHFPVKVFVSWKKFYTIVSSFTRMLLNNYINNGFVN